MPPKGYRHLSIREEVYKRLEEFAVRKGLSTTVDAVVVLLDYADIYSKIEYLLQKGVSLPQSGVKETQGDSATQGSMTAHSHATGSSMKTEQYATKGGKKRRVDEVLKDQKITCISELRKAGKTYPERIIEKAREAGAVKIDLGHDVCVVDPGFWWEFWKIVKGFKTPNDGENLKELKNEKMKWLYSELRKEGILVLDSSRKPPTWIVDKRVEIPEKAFEIGRTSQEEEESVGEDETVDEEYDYEDIYK